MKHMKYEDHAHASIILQTVSDPEFQNSLQDQKSEKSPEDFEFLSPIFIFLSPVHNSFVSTSGYFVSVLTLDLKDALDWYEQLFKIILFRPDYQITEKIIKLFQKT